MALFSTRNSDGASSKGESCNTVDNAKWRGIQDRALKANPELNETFGDEAVRRRLLGRANFDKREQN